MGTEIFMCQIVEDLNDDNAAILRIDYDKEKQSFILNLDGETFTLPFSFAPDLAMVLLNKCEIKNLDASQKNCL